MLSLISISGLLALATVLYRLFQHPLKSFPGPKLAAVSSLYRKYYDGVLGGEMANHLQDLHKIYGPVVRIAPNELHFCDPAAFSSIYYTGSPYTKYPPFYDSFSLRHSNFGLINPGHAKIRRDMMSPLFSRRAILKLEFYVQRKIDRLIYLLGKYRPDQPVNMSWALRSLTLDLIMTYCFAVCPDTIEAQDFIHPLVVSLQRRLAFRPLSMCFPWSLPLSLSLPSWFLGTLLPSTRVIWIYRDQNTARVDAILKDAEVLDRAEHETIYHHLVNPSSAQRYPDHVPTRLALIEEADLLIGAGSDTVANASTVGVFHALNNPGVYAELKEELTEAWPDIEVSPGYEKLEKLPYLTAFIKEALRTSHGVVSPLPRVINTSRAIIGGYAVPKGTVVSMSVTFLHKNPDIYPSPNAFIPERWIGLDASKLENYLAPFSRGPRMCLGINLAWCEMYLIFGNIFRKLDMELYNTTVKDFSRLKDHFVASYRGRQMQVLVKTSKGL